MTHRMFLGFFVTVSLLFSSNWQALAQEEISDIPVGQFQSVTELLASSQPLQIAFAILIIGIILIVSAYKYFSRWVDSQKYCYSRPYIAGFLKTLLFPFFAIALVTSINTYVQVTDLFSDADVLTQNLSSYDTFSKILNTLNILAVGYAVGRLVPIILEKREKIKLLKKDFEAWKEMKGFSDDEKDLFHRIFDWIPPRSPPETMSKEQYQNYLQTEEGRHYLQNYRTSKGASIGSFVPKVSDPFREWQNSEREKYEKYYQSCVSGNNESGRKLKSGADPQEIFTINTWMEEKRLGNYDSVIPGGKPPGYAEEKMQDLPKSLNQIIPTVIFLATVIALVSWWGVDLFVLGTIVAGFGVGIGFALKETMENFFAYFTIRKDKIFTEGDRVEIENYNGYIHNITTRVTYIRHPLNESMAIFPTRQLVAAKVINYSKDMKFVPAMVSVGVSYLNNAKQVSAVLTKIGHRAMKEIKDEKGRHLIVQNKCPYIDENKPSCGCDKDLTLDLKQPRVRFDKFGDSSLDFRMWVYVKEYIMQFKVESAIRMMMQEEFARYDIRIPWPIRTIYQGDEKKEVDEIAKINKERQDVLDKYGTGDVKFG